MRHPTIYKLDGNQPDAMLLASAFPLQSKDVIYVATANIARWGRTLNHLLPAIQWLPFTTFLH
jgi:polysaccharide export outer membrane protein